MSKIFKVFLLLGIFGFLGPALVKAENIQSFDVKAEVLENGSVLIEEVIVYDFEGVSKHGIYRGIPLKGIEISEVSVSDGLGRSYPFSTSKVDNNLRIKIGDPDVLISGVHQYRITYQVKKALGYFKDHDELYWNVTGNEWEIPIKQASFSFKLPKQVSAENIQQDCFTGLFGSEEKVCSFTLGRFQSENVLLPSEGLTVVIGWPKGIVAGPSLFERALVFLKEWGLWLLTLVVFLYLLVTWLKHGKDIKLDKTIIAQYELPKELRPLEVGYILRQKVLAQDISATIVGLAVRGYLKIKETERKIFFFKQKDWELIKTKDFSTDVTLEPYEKLLLEKIFLLRGKISISQLQMERKLPDYFRKLKEMITMEMVEDEYFVTEPTKYRNVFVIIGAVFFISAYFILTRSFFLLFSVALPLIASGILFSVFAIFMPKKTRKGAETLWQILGFKEYIKKAEKYRVQFQEKENIFEKFLPYAMVFGLAKKWAKAFEGIYNQQPSWYESSSIG
ncbi:MAG: DUF2207 domain-containing protein, partial [bacterium]|nr:DUF2207 domain-containing protein [bacterium]